MATLSELRELVLALPDTAEGTHFRLPSFRVSDKPIIAVEKDNAHVLVRLDEPQARAWVGENPAVYEEVWQNRKYLIGIRFALENVTATKLREIVEQSWRSKASKKRIQSYDKERSEG